MSHPLAVVKVGGSLYDLPDLATRLREWLAAEALSDDSILLVPGGGLTVDGVRDLDRRHSLGEEASHWLALRELSLNAHFLAELLSPACVLRDAEECRKKGTLAILDIFSFAHADERHPDHLAHRWAVTSDSIAARAAVVCDADYLILLKSVTIPQDIEWEQAAERGFVDEWFARTLRQARNPIRVRGVNFREWRP